MARRPRVHFPKALYHVIARGNQRQDIFLDEKDNRTYLYYLSEYKSRYPFRLYAYVLMKNHLHLLLEVETTPLSKIMQSLQFRYTRYFNRRYSKVGHLFQGRYKAILCDKAPYLLELVRYIHLNPIRSKVVKNLEKYKWVSHLGYLGMIKDSLVDEEFVLGQFGKNKYVARGKYRKFVLDGMDLGHQGRYYEVKDQRFLGGDEFIEGIETSKAINTPVLFDIPMEEMVREVSRVVGVTRDRMYSLSRDRRGAYGRGLVAYLARKLAGYLVKDIAGYFGREPMTISQAIINVEDLLRRDEGLTKEVALMERHLIRKRKKKYLLSIA